MKTQICTIINCNTGHTKNPWPSCSIKWLWWIKLMQQRLNQYIQVCIPDIDSRCWFTAGPLMEGIFCHYPCNGEEKDNCCWCVHLSWVVLNWTDIQHMPFTCICPVPLQVVWKPSSNLSFQLFTVQGKQEKMQESPLESDSFLSLNPLTKTQETPMLCIILWSRRKENFYSFRVENREQKPRFKLWHFSSFPLLPQIWAC